MSQDEVLKIELVEVGTVIRLFRKRKGIKQKELFSGLCTKEVYVRIEKGKGMPNVLLVERLFSRLHLQHRLLERIISGEDFEQQELRTQVEDYINLGHTKQAELLLEQYDKKEKKDKLEEQYLLWKRAEIMEEEQPELAGSLYLKAFQMTMEHVEYKIISEEELDMYLGYRRCIEPMQEKEQREILCWIENHMFTEQIYPDCYFVTAYLLGKKLYQEQRYEEAEKLCEEIIKSINAIGRQKYLLEFSFLRIKCRRKQELPCLPDVRTVYYLARAVGDAKVTEAIEAYCKEEFSWDTIR